MNIELRTLNGVNPTIEHVFRDATERIAAAAAPVIRETVQSLSAAAAAQVQGMISGTVGRGVGKSVTVTARPSRANRGSSE